LHALECLRRPGCNVRHFADRVYALHRHIVRIIPLYDRRSEILIDIEPILDRVRLVVLATNQATAITARTRRARLQSLERRLTHVARRARAQSPNQFSVIGVEEQHRIDLATDAGERLGESFSLRHSTHCAVENCAARRLGRRHRFAQNTKNHRIGDEISAIHELFGFQSERRALTYGSAEQIARRDLGNAKTSCKQLALSSLPSARRSEQNNYHYRTGPSVAGERILPAEPYASLLHESVVLAEQHVLVDLRHRIERDTDHDQERRATECERNVDRVRDEDRQ